MTINKSFMMPVIVAVFLTTAMMLIAAVHHDTAEQMLKRQFYEQGIVLTRSLSNSIWTTLGRGEGHSPARILQTYNLDTLDSEIKHLIVGTPVLKLKLFNADGVMKYSSNKNDVRHGDSDDLKVNQNINLVALDVVSSNQPTASYRFREMFDTGEMTYKNRYIFSAYLPVPVPNTDQAGAVLEVYYDVSRIITEFDNNNAKVNLMLALTGSILLVLISYLILKNEKTNRKQALERERYLAMLSSTNNDLLEKTAELTRIQLRTERIAEERSVFMSRMSHELRAPMNAVIGLTDLLTRTKLSERQRGYLNAIQCSGEILLDVTEEILSVGRLETGFLEIGQQRFLLREIIDNVMEVLGSRACRQGLELILEYTPDIDCYVKGDPVRMRQILVNLVSNAIKFTNQGSVSLRVKYHKGEAPTPRFRFEVIDTGVGISEEDQKKVFAAYCSLNNGNTVRGGNTGLGLAICRRLVEAMGGVIGVRSTVGQGSCFWFELPLSIEDGENRTLAALLLDSAVQKILIVSAQRSGHMLQQTFQLAGATAELANTRTDIQELLHASVEARHTYDLFFVDSNFAACPVEAVASAISCFDAYKDTPMVVMVPVSKTSEPGIISEIRNVLIMNTPIVPRSLRELFLQGGAYIGKKQEAKNVPTTVTVNPLHELDSRPNKVLVVDDNPINRELLLEMLTELNLSAKGVGLGRSALDAVREEYFDLILLDYRLPDFEGHEVAAEIRKRAVDSRQPVIIGTSSDNSLRHQQLCLEAGVDDFLQTPIKLSDFSTRLMEWLPKISISSGLAENDDRVNSHSLFRAPVLDKRIIAGLKKRDDQNPNFFNHLVKLFVDDGFERIQTLKDQLQRSDFAGIERTAHSMKSGCIYLGAARMGRYCDVLCSVAKNKAFNETRRVLHYFIEEFDRIILELDGERIYSEELLN